MVNPDLETSDTRTPVVEDTTLEPEELIEVPVSLVHVAEGTRAGALHEDRFKKFGDNDVIALAIRKTELVLPACMPDQRKRNLARSAVHIALSQYQDTEEE